MSSIQVLIDFERNRDYTDAIDDISAYVISVGCNLGMRRPYQEVADGGECNIVVRNVDGRFSPENSASPLYGYLLPHRSIRIVHIKDDGTETQLWNGWVKEYRFKSIVGPSAAAIDENVTIVCTDAFSLLVDLEAYLGIFTNTTYDEVIRALLPQTAIPSGGDTDFWILGYVGSSELGETTYLGDHTDYSDLEAGLSVIPEYGDITSGEAMQIINELMTTERGKFFFGRDGKAYGWNRHHFFNDLTNDASINNGVGGTYTLKGYDYRYGELVNNVIRIQLHPRKVGTSETLWELDTPIEIDGNSVKTIEIILRRSNGQFAASGSLSTSGATFSQGTATVDVTARGGRGIITLTNEAAGVAILSALNVDGTPTVNQSQMVIEASDDDSVALYGKRNALNIDMKAVSTYEDAFDIANFELFRRKDPRGIVYWISYEPQLEDEDDSHCVDWGMGTRLAINLPEKYHSDEYFIIGEERSYNIRDKLHRCKFYLEPAVTGVDNNFWYLEDSASELGVNTYLGY